MLSIILCAYWPFVYFLWRNVSSSPLPIFNQVVCFWPWHRCLPDCLERSLLLKAIGHLPRVLWGSLFPASWGYWALTQGSLGQPLPCFSRLLGTYPGFSGAASSLLLEATGHLPRVLWAASSLLLKAIGHLPRFLWGSLFPASQGYWALTQGSLGSLFPLHVCHADINAETCPSGKFHLTLKDLPFPLIVKEVQWWVLQK